MDFFFGELFFSRGGVHFSIKERGIHFSMGDIIFRLRDALWRERVSTSESLEKTLVLISP